MFKIQLNPNSIISLNKKRNVKRSDLCFFIIFLNGILNHFYFLLGNKKILFLKQKMIFHLRTNERTNEHVRRFYERTNERTNMFAYERTNERSLTTMGKTDGDRVEAKNRDRNRSKDEERREERRKTEENERKCEVERVKQRNKRGRDNQRQKEKEREEKEMKTSRKD